NYSIDDSGTTFLFADESFSPKLAEVVDHPKCPDVKVWMADTPPPIGFMDYEDLIASSTSVPDCRRGGEALAGLFYTAGTRGVSQGEGGYSNTTVPSSRVFRANGSPPPAPRFFFLSPVFFFPLFPRPERGGASLAEAGFTPRILSPPRPCR